MTGLDSNGGTQPARMHQYLQKGAEDCVYDKGMKLAKLNKCKRLIYIAKAKQSIKTRENELLYSQSMSPCD